MKNTLLILLLFTMPISLFAQRWEAGVFGGASHYNGDLSEGIIMLNQTHGVVGAMVKYNFSEKLTLRGGLYYGTISGNDENATDLIRRNRNLHFTSQITEFSLIPEFNLMGYKIGSRRQTLTPFVYAGIGIFKFNPYATDANGRAVPLQPLRTEGQGSIVFQDASGNQQRELYALTQVNIPLGIGLKFALSQRFTMTIEMSARKLFTDYLDDVSTTYIPTSVIDEVGGPRTEEWSDRRLGLIEPGPDPLSDPRGNPTTNDWYYFHGIGITYTFFPPSCFKF